MRQNVDRLEPVLLASTRRNFVAQHRLLAKIVHKRREYKFRIVCVAHRPAGEAARHRDHIVLGITTLHSERVQLHPLTPVVLIEPVRQPPDRSRDNRVRHSVHTIC